VNIEHGSSPHDVGMCEVAPHFRQRAPIRSLGDTVNLDEIVKMDAPPNQSPAS
jgi:hypothetical protein